MEETNETTRPAFLKVLCILTWVGSGIGLISGLLAIIGSSASESAIRSLGDATLDGTMENMKMIQYAGLACTVLCIIGSVMMWQLKKAGFFIYLIGEVAPLVLSFVLLGSLASSGGPVTGGIAAAAGVIGAIFPAAFVIMYGLNLKHMK
jgi:hypothetical protein